MDVKAAASRLRGRGQPDIERGQAVLRSGIVAATVAYAAVLALHDPASARRLGALALCSSAFSVALLVVVVRRPGVSPLRRLAGIAHDNVAATAWLYLSGPSGALALFIYPFVTVGNGFRYGVRYLVFSGVFGTLGIAVLVSFDQDWASSGAIGAGLVLSNVLVTVYTGLLLNRLRRTQAQLAHLASSDSLTGLPNRRLFMDRLADMIAAPDRRHLACLYLDLDGFKAVNDRYGHNVGDQLLSEVGRAVSRCVRGTDVVARLGGDEFTVVAEGVAGPDEAQLVADRIIRAVGAIRTVAGQDVEVSASIGISFLPADAPAPTHELLRSADQAMYAAKRAGKGCSRLAEPLAPAPVPVG